MYTKRNIRNRPFSPFVHQTKPNLRPISLDDGSCLLGHRINGSRRVTSQLHGDDGGIDNPHILRSVDLDPGVNDTAEILGQHGT